MTPTASLLGPRRHCPSAGLPRHLSSFPTFSRKFSSLFTHVVVLPRGRLSILTLHGRTSFWFTALATIKFLVSLKSQAVLRQRATLQHQAKSTDVAQKDTTSSGSPSTTVQTSPYPSNNAQADHAMEYVKSGTLFVSPRRMDQSPAVSPSLPQYYGTARECEHCALSNADESGSVGGASNLSSNSEGFALTPDASSVDEDSLDDGGASNLSLEYDDNWVDRGAWSPPSSEEDSWDDEGAYDWPSEDEDSSDDLGF